MKILSLLGGRPRIGLAIGLDRVAVSLRVAGGAGATQPVRLYAVSAGPDAGAWPALAATLGELRDEIGAEDAIVSVALLPPLAQLRRLEMPRLRAAERRSVLARDASRYFFDARDPQVVEAQVAAGAGGSPEPVVAAAAPAHVVDAIYEAAREVGWSIDLVTPAAAAWLAGALRACPILARGPAVVVILDDARVDVLFAQDGTLETARRIPRHGDWIAATSDAVVVASRFPLPASRHDDEPRVAIIGGRDDRTALESMLHERGASAIAPVRELASLCESPIAVAAAFAHESASLALVPERIRTDWTRRERRVARVLGAAAAAGVLATALLELWGAHRELAAIEAQRAAIRPRVARIMQVRDTIGALDARLAALATRELSLPQWSAVIAELARHLPADAHVVGLRAQGDSLALEGAAERAAGVFEALQQAPGVASVRAEAPIRREMQADGQTPVERFALAARVSPGAMRARSRRGEQP